MPLKSIVVCLCFQFSGFPAFAQPPVEKLASSSFTWALESVGDVDSVTTSDDLALIGSRSKDFESAEVHCVETSSGRIRWTIAFPRLEKSWLDNRSSGIRSNITVERDRVVFLSNRSEIVCLDLNGLSDGNNDGIVDPLEQNNTDVIWRYDLREKLGVFKKSEAGFGTPWPSPRVIGNRVYCATGNADVHGLPDGAIDSLKNHPVPAPTSPSFVCLNLDDGSLVWSFNAPSADVKYASVASPVRIAANGDSLMFAVGGDGSAYGISELTGQLLWKLDSQFFWSWFPPIVDGKFVYICNSIPPGTAFKGAEILCYTQESLVRHGKEATPVWRYHSEAYRGSWVPPVVSQGILFVRSDTGILIAIDATLGKELWRDEIKFNETDFVPLKIRQNVLFVSADAVDDSTVESGVRCYEVGRERKLLKQVTWGHYLSAEIEFTSALAILPSYDGLFAAPKGELFPVGSKNSSEDSGKENTIQDE